MQYQILGEQITIHTMNLEKGNIFSISGSGFSSLGLPNTFYFQMPGRFSPEENACIDKSGNLVNTLPDSLDRQILSIFLHKSIRSLDLTKN
jgi:hypothetical protein